MQLTIIADTHGDHEALGSMSGEVLIHCGDVLNLFNEPWNDLVLERIDAWFGRQEFDLILCIGGNHDVELQRLSASGHKPFENAHYLEGEEYTFEGVKFFGAPWVPHLQGHAFFVEDDSLAEKWEHIPGDVDVLITHTPPYGIMDTSSAGLVLGCPHLSRKLAQLNPGVHCFGHVHKGSGVEKRDNTTFINAALVNRDYKICRRPFIVEI
ncbi:MAG: metallophosphoesterase [Pseudomonadota bacterium]